MLFPFNPLPKPNGKFNIGTKIFTWTDSSRFEWFTEKDTIDLRKIVVQIWYPSNQDPTANPVPYIDFIEKRIPVLANQLSDHLNLNMPLLHKKLRLPHFFVKHFKQMLSFSYENLQIIKEDNLPVLIFSHGLGGMRTQNSVYLQQLASHGYIVAAMDHSYDANISIFTDGQIALFNSEIAEVLPADQQQLLRFKQLQTRSLDISFIIDKLEILNSGILKTDLKNKMNLKKIGIFGHSFGGTTGIYASIMDSRIGSCIALDPWYEPLPKKIIISGITKPYLHISQEFWESEMNYKIRDEIILNSDKNSFVSTIVGSKHPDFIDFPLMVPKRIQKILKQNKKIGTMNSRYVYNILNDLQLNFFNSFVKSMTKFDYHQLTEEYQALRLTTNNSPNS